MRSRSKKRRMAREAGAASPRSHVGQASQGLPAEALPSLKCYNITEKSIFVEGLQNAGLEVVPRPCDRGNDPNQVIIALQSQDDRHQVMRALHNCRLEGQTTYIITWSAGIRLRYKMRQQPRVKHIRRCVANAFHERAFKEDLARENFEYAAAMQKARRNIEVPKVAAKRRKANKGLMDVKAKAIPEEISRTESNESEGLAEQTHKQKGGEEQVKMRDDNFRPETSPTQQMKAGETKSDLRGERSHIKHTAREGERSYVSGVIMSTRSSTPDDMLSALFASLN